MCTTDRLVSLDVEMMPFEVISTSFPGLFYLFSLTVLCHTAYSHLQMTTSALISKANFLFLIVRWCTFGRILLNVKTQARPKLLFDILNEDVCLALVFSPRRRRRWGIGWFKNSRSYCMSKFCYKNAIIFASCVSLQLVAEVIKYARLYRREKLHAVCRSFDLLQRLKRTVTTGSSY